MYLDPAKSWNLLTSSECMETPLPQTEKPTQYQRILPSIPPYTSILSSSSSSGGILPLPFIDFQNPTLDSKSDVKKSNHRSLSPNSSTEDLQRHKHQVMMAMPFSSSEEMLVDTSHTLRPFRPTTGTIYPVMIILFNLVLELYNMHKFVIFSSYLNLHSVLCNISIY
jgi:hypothetical protein